ncbi:MAG: two-component regulator propeller domain-containing protein [Saprospiraceae bacterium]
MRTNYFFSLLFVLIGINLSLAQSKTIVEKDQFGFFEHFGELHGVIDRVKPIIQDHQGYIWFGVHHKGLIRFDGVHFKLYANDPENPNSLPDNSVEDMLVDKNGLIWMATPTGIVSLDPITSKFYSIPSNNLKNYICLLEDQNHKLWAGTSTDGLTYYDPKSKSMIAWKSEIILNGYTGKMDSISSFSSFSNLAKRDDGTIWARTKHYRSDGTGFQGIVVIDSFRRSLKYFSAELFYKKISASFENGTMSQSFYLDRKKECIWMGGFGPGLIQFSLNTHLWNLIDLDQELKKDALNNYIYAIRPKNDSTIWLGTEKGLKNYSTNFNSFTEYSGNGSQLWEVQKARYLDVFKDKNGITWFGTDIGLSRLDPYKQQFLPDPLFPDNLNVQAITEYQPTNERLYAEWNVDGFFRIVAQNNKTQKIRQADQRLDLRPNDVPCVHQIFVAPDKRIWILLNKGIGWLDPKSLFLTIINFPILNNPPFRTNTIWPRNISNDSNGNLWIATFGNGIIHFSPTTKQFFKFIQHPFVNGLNEENSNFIFNVFCDSSQLMYIGKNGSGLEIWDRIHNTRSLFQPKMKDNQSFGGKYTTAIAKDSEGMMWFGTEGGLCKYIPGAGPDSLFERVKGLQEWILKIIPDQNGHLWLTTNKGLVCYDVQNKSYKKFSYKDGMTVAFNDYTPLFCSSDGTIWLGNNINFHPSSFTYFPPVAEPLIVNMKIYDKQIRLQSSRLKNGQEIFSEIELKPDEEVFTIEIGTLGFTNPEQSNLIYRLQSNDDWKEAGLQNTFSFNQLPGGKYEFELKAISASGIVSGKSILLPLKIVPPFYRTKWFLFLSIISMGYFFYLVFRIRELQRLKQEKLRLRIARDLHDEVGSTLSTISILSESAQLSVQEDLDQARLSNIADKARSALDSMSDIVWSINPKNDSMEMVLARMSTYASEMLENAGTTLHFQIGEEIESLTLPMAKRKDFYLLFKEAIHNCAKHAHAKHVEVKLEKQGNNLKLVVKDDGVGLNAQNILPVPINIGGNGLQNMHSRAKVLGGTLMVYSTPGIGTELQFILPLST